MNDQVLIDWLLEGDVSIQYQVHRDLLGILRDDLQKRIPKEGWGKQFLDQQKADGHWGDRFYQPKWISTHYTLLDLKMLGIPPDIPQVKDILQVLLTEQKGLDGGINPAREVKESDVCVNGMFLSYACYFGAPQADLQSIIDFMLSQRLPDGGFNCRFNRSGAKHSSLHSTLSNMEGFLEYLRKGYTYRKAEVLEAQKTSLEFILLHRLFRSDRTGDIIHKDFLKLSYPGRWRFDILRALDHFQDAGFSWDNRMQNAVDVLLAKRRMDRTWTVQAHHPGQVHFYMEKAGKPSRWNTLRALRVLKNYSLLELAH